MCTEREPWLGLQVDAAGLVAVLDVDAFSFSRSFKAYFSMVIRGNKNMIFCTKRTLKVKLDNPALLIKHQHDPIIMLQEGKENRLEISLKILAALYVFFNIALAIMGYSILTGNLETLGISTNEFDFSLSTLLFQGYTTVILDNYSAAAKYTIIGPILILIIAACIAALPALYIFKDRSKIDRAVATLVIAGILFTLPVIPLFGLAAGERGALSTLKFQNDSLPSDTTKELTIFTKDKLTITGTPVFMSDQYSYILSKNKIYKIMNRDNHIVSVTTFNMPAQTQEAP